MADVSYRDARLRFDRYMAGWSIGAAYSPIPPALVDDKDFTRGWGDARKAKRDAAQAEADRCGISVPVVKLV